MLKTPKNLRNLKISFAVFAVCMTVSLIISLSVFEIEHESHQLKRDMDVTTVTNIVTNLAASAFGPVASLGATVSANHTMGFQNKTEAFHRFVETRNLVGEFPSVIGWTFASIFNHETLSRQIDEINNEPGRANLGYGPMKIIPAPSKGDPIAAATMIAPPALREKALGYNILSNSLRREPAMQALQTGTMQLSEIMKLKTNARGLILFLPIYKTASTPETFEKRQENIIGFIMAVYAAKSLFAQVADTFDEMRLNVDIYDIGPANAEWISEPKYAPLLASNHQNLTNDNDQKMQRLAAFDKVDNNYRDIEIAGRIWRVLVRQDPDAALDIHYHDYLVVGIFVASLLLSVLFAVLIYQQLNRATSLAVLVEAKTRRLRETQDELEKSRDEAETLSLTDPLTGLSNRRSLSLNFTKLLEMTSREKATVSMILIDIDYFKSINDTHGHDIGDGILTSFADLATSKLNEDNVCFSRLGGDEFAILSCSLKGECTAAAVADSLLQVMTDAGDANGISSVSASIGVARLGAKDETLSHLMKSADVALYQAKTQGRSRVVKYTQSMGYRSKRKDSILKAVNIGFEGDEFVPAFHPYVSLESNKLIGFEVLARWQHKTRGLLSPGAFWEALCDDGVATQISNMVAKKALRQAGEMKADGIDIGRLGFNATTQMLEDEAFAETFVADANSCGLMTENLKIEVTERILLSRNADRITTTLEQLSDRGVHIAFDDFGTGFASLTHLRTYPIDCVKIDRSFIKEIEEDDKSRAIVSGITQMAHDLGFIVIAEGIETEAQRKLLTELNCDACQGFLFGEPVLISNVIKSLKDNTLLAA